MFENHMLQPEDVKGYEDKEPVDFRLDVSLEELEELTKGNEKLESSLDLVLKNCLAYTETVLKMKKIIMENKGKDAAEEILAGRERRIIHNETMKSIDDFAKLCEEEGVSSSWVIRLRPNKNEDNRSAYGRFAIGITMYRLINSV